MNLFLSLALRNVFRNRLRSAVALMAIAAGCAALIINSGIVFNIFRELRDDAILGQYGHIQIYRRGYSAGHLEDPERYLIAPDEAARIVALARSDPRVVRATLRRGFSGLMARNDRYVPFFGVAVEPEADIELSRHVLLRAGRPLSQQNPYGVLAGLGLAKKLNASVGDELSVMTTMQSGDLSSLHVRLQGIFEGGIKEYDDWTLKVPLPVAEHLLQDRRTEQIVLLLRKTDQVEKVRADLESAFRNDGLDMEIRSWNQLALFYNQVVGLFGKELTFLRFIIGAIVILAIGNAIGMSIVERHVELTTFRALGVRTHSVARLLLTEAILEGLVGAALGMALGVAVAHIVTAIGISYPSPPGSTRPFLGGVDVVPGSVATAFAVSLIATLLSAVFPIWRVMRLPIAITLRGGPH
ncbi:MAG: FtsX-like permease family protein [Candidatus Sulfotelmatobacter sp.]